jgi:aryl-alcohol dehydrogenase-like predicted oxidoreductase
MSDIPDGATSQVAQFALAWAMVKESRYIADISGLSAEERLAHLVDAYNRAFRAIAEEKPMAPPTKTG